MIEHIIMIFMILIKKKATYLICDGKDAVQNQWYFDKSYKEKTPVDKEVDLAANKTSVSSEDIKGKIGKDRTI